MSGATVRGILTLIVFTVFFSGALFMVVASGLGLTATVDMFEFLEMWSSYFSGLTGLITGYYFGHVGGKSTG